MRMFLVAILVAATAAAEDRSSNVEPIQGTFTPRTADPAVVGMLGGMSGYAVPGKVPGNVKGPTAPGFDHIYGSLYWPAWRQSLPLVVY